jgi:hypothetical protein
MYAILAVCCTIFSEYMVILYIVTLFETNGHVTFQELLSKNQKKSQKLIAILHNIYKILPMVVLKVNIMAQTANDMNGGFTRIFNDRSVSIVYT